MCSNHADDRSARTAVPSSIFPRQVQFVTAMLLALTAFSVTARAADVLEVIDHDPSYSTFSTLLHRTGLDGELKSGAGYTVFAPSNAAFDELPTEVRVQLLASDSASARRAIESLLIAKAYGPKDIAHNRVLLTSIGGHRVVVDGTEGRLTAGGTEILSVDTSPTNGVIYTIDGVSLDRHVLARGDVK